MRWIPLALVLAALVSPARAGTTVWEVGTAADFDEGTLTGVTVVAPGGLRLGPVLQRTELEDGAVWCLLQVPGKGLFAGTARGACVIRLDETGPVKILETEDLMITALAADGEGTLFAAAVPDGKIYRIPPAGEPVITRVPDPYVWALALDPAGHLLAATGPNGRLYRIEKGTGWVKEVFQSDRDKNLVSLAVGPAGEVYCGSAENGILYRILPDGKAEAIHDFSEREVRALVMGPHGLTVGTNTPSKGFDQVSFAGNLSGTLSSEEWGSSDRKDVMSKILGAALYRVDAEGRVHELARFEKTFLLGVGVNEAGTAFVATGDSGRVFSVDRERRVATVADLEEEQVLAMIMGPDGPAALGSGSPGVVHRVTAVRGLEGTYLSKVHDAGFPARFGLATWWSRGEPGFRFRSGNTDKPDRTWSEWSDPQRSSGRPMACPRGRYVQFRVDFAGDPSAAVERVRIHYEVQNQRPRIKGLKVGEDSGEEDTAAFFRPRSEEPLKIQVEAEDPNGDALVFRFFYRKVGETGWIPMSADPVDKPEFPWATADLPDGMYEIRVVASDGGSNPDALSEERVSRPVPVDNRRPFVEGLVVTGGKTPEARGTARDAGSAVTRVDVRVDGGSWVPLAPLDGVYDSHEEAFACPLPGLEAGLHRLWVRVFDRAGNAGVESAEFRVE